MPNISSEALPAVDEEMYIKIIKKPVYAYVGCLKDEDQRHFSLHKHDRITEIIYIVSGETTYIINGEKYQAKPGDILVVNSGVMHEEFYWSEKSIEIYYCAITNLCVKGLREQWLIPASVSPILSVGAEELTIRMLFERLFEEGCARKIGYDIICNDLVSLISVIILRLVNEQEEISNEKSTVSQPRVLSGKIKQYLDLNFSQNITVDELAEEFHIAPSYLAHIFKKYIGTPPIRYQVAKRMDEAKRLLSCTNLNVNAIAYMVGYENINNFYDPFKRYVGMTPNQYRQQIKNHATYYYSEST